MTQRQNTKNSNQSQNSNKPQKSDNKLRMFIDASKHEETRVVVAKNGKMEDLEVESLVRRQIKGNIYLAKITRVEPSLQAAFVNYGGNRHGFLPFSEIHPDYYRIPVADRERLMAEQAELEEKAREEEARLEAEEDLKAASEEENQNDSLEVADGSENNNIIEIDDEDVVMEAGVEATADSENSDEEAVSDEVKDEDQKDQKRGRGRFRRGGRNGGRRYEAAKSKEDRVTDDEEELGVEPFWKRMRKAYKIQEVIKRGQIMLIQVGKEERGNKGAAVTTYITLPGRYCVLMPNTPQSGGVSRKIANFKDRKRMREILKDLDVPLGMSVILRTAGTTRTKIEIKKDLDYLMRLWNTARDLTLKSSAPALINEEGSLIRRAIRDIYHKDIDEVVVSGESGYKTAKEMMKMLMPTHVKKVVQYKEPVPLFIAEKLEQQIEDIHSPQVQLKSGGYLVINPTEALVSIDVNSGRSTKERNIEDTALRTNIEAAEEIARQLKLRDLGGLVVIDFIDMENRRYNAKVEGAMRQALSDDRARIQVGRISSFGLMEMSRQRLHPSLTETHFESCPHCRGMGIVKTVDTMALTILRAIEETALQKPDVIMTITMAENVALYLFNHHRRAITALEERYKITIVIQSGSIESERGFDMASTARIIETLDYDAEEDVIEVETSKIDTDVEPQEKSERPKKSRNRNRNRQKDDQGEESEQSQPQQQKSAAKPEKKSQGPVAPQVATIRLLEEGEPIDERVIFDDEVIVTSETVETTETDLPVKGKKGKSAKSPRAAKKKINITEKEEAVAVAEEAPAEPVETEAKAKPRKKVVSKTSAKSKAEPEPINDNADVEREAEEINIAARGAEKVNEAPKSKKKGWWNKITS